MRKAFIWDLDGTLLDSYDAILAGIEETYTHYGLDFDLENGSSLQHLNLFLLRLSPAISEQNAAKYKHE